MRKEPGRSRRARGKVTKMSQTAVRVPVSSLETGGFMPQPDLLEIVKSPKGWALRRGASGPNLVSGTEKDEIVDAGGRIATAFGLPLLMGGQPISTHSDISTGGRKKRAASLA